MIDIKVNISIDDIQNLVEKKQVPYALSRTLTDLGRIANKKNKQHAKSEYMIRRPWMLRGFDSIGSRKETCKAIILHRHRYMSKHERGGFVRRQNGRFNAVPQLRGGRRSVRASVALRDPKTFISGRAVIKRKPSSRTYELMFKLVDEAKYLPSLQMEEIAQEVVNQKAQEVFQRHWLSAISNVW